MLNSQLIKVLDNHDIQDIVLVDVGAKGALEYFRNLLSITEMYAFEPNYIECANLKKRYLNHKFKKLRINQYALGVADVAQVSLNITQNASMSSLLTPDKDNYLKHFGQYKEFDKWADAISVKSQTPVQMRTLDSYALEQGIKQIDYLKIDTQGSELEVLKGSSQLLIDKSIAVIKVEVSTIPVYTNQALFTDVDAFLRSFGYTLVDFRTYRRDDFATHEHYAPCGDAIYVVDRLNGQFGFKAAIILFSLGYKSLAHRFLEDYGLSKDEIQSIAKLGSVGFASRLKKFLRLLLPPIFVEVKRILSK
ncbi:FkbM family methyltransferase [Nubsella zeaxanthinifaciens]|uniref:FkbM family methyltransferase n=1 Tax=Nubsella zeaxanthinifaciens TaxID=392412 RepID=UPI003CFC31C1